MKDKEKQVEEMAKDFKSYLPSAWYNDKCVNGEVYSMVKHAYEDNYRKLPENARVFIPDGQMVLLSREEHEKLLKVKENCLELMKQGEEQILSIGIDRLKDFREKYKEALKQEVNGENVDCFVESLKIFDKTLKEFINE